MGLNATLEAKRASFKSENESALWPVKEAIYCIKCDEQVAQRALAVSIFLG